MNKRIPIIFMLLLVSVIAIGSMQVSGQMPFFPTTTSTTFTTTYGPLTISTDGLSTLTDLYGTEHIVIPSLTGTFTVSLSGNNNQYFGWISGGQNQGCELFESYSPSGTYVLFNIPSSFTIPSAGEQVTVYGTLMGNNVPCYYGSTYQGIYVYSISSGYNYGGMYGQGQTVTTTTSQTVNVISYATQSVTTTTTQPPITSTQTTTVTTTQDALGGMGIWILVGIAAIVAIVLAIVLGMRMLKGGGGEE